MLTAHDVGLQIGRRVLELKQTRSAEPKSAEPKPSKSAQSVPIKVEPVINVAAPIVNIEPSPAPIVNIAPAEIIVQAAEQVVVPAPVVNVAPAEVVVNVPAPVVNVSLELKPIADVILVLADAIKGNRDQLETIQSELRGQANATASLAQSLLAPRSLVMKDGKPVGIKVQK